MRGLSVVRDATMVVLLSVVVALSVNALRTEGIPVVAKVPYRILVPCPEPGGDVTPLAPDEVRWGSAGDLLIDARPLEGSVGSASGVRRVPFDFLDPVSEELLRDLVAVRADRVVVFGDGGLPDSGEELAKELSGRGVRNVFFIRGGVDAIRGHLDAKEVTP